jgi:hypothetical protein|tara:strand:+ start:11274 stop:11966 length:693 start_codon:yes stop_codon:yes gene_type:complete
MRYNSPSKVWRGPEVAIELISGLVGVLLGGGISTFSAFLVQKRQFANERAVRSREELEHRKLVMSNLAYKILLILMDAKRMASALKTAEDQRVADQPLWISLQPVVPAFRATVLDREEIVVTFNDGRRKLAAEIQMLFRQAADILEIHERYSEKRAQLFEKFSNAELLSPQRQFFLSREPSALGALPAEVERLANQLMQENDSFLKSAETAVELYTGKPLPSADGQFTDL